MMGRRRLVPTYPSTLILVKNWDRTKREKMFAKSPGLRHFWLMREHLLLSNNCLFYRWEFPDKTRKLFKVPDAIKSEIMEITHCFPLSGHPIIKRTTQRFCQSFHWYNTADYMTTFVGACEKCALSKKANKAKLLFNATVLCRITDGQKTA